MLAVAISYNRATGETLATPFEDGVNPVDRAHAFIREMKCDPHWSDCLWTVAADEEAKEARGEALCQALGFNQK